MLAEKMENQLRDTLIARIEDFEKQTGYDATYMKNIADSSTALATEFSKFSALSHHRAYAPVDVYHVARMATLKSEDCGTCLQLSITYALRDNIPSALVEDCVRHPERLPERLKLVHDFAIAVARNSPDYLTLLQQMNDKYGTDITIELSMLIATARVYPTVKRGMGYATTCSLTTFNYGNSK